MEEEKSLDQRLFARIEDFSSELETNFLYYLMSCHLILVTNKDPESKYKVKYSANLLVKKFDQFKKDLDERVLKKIQESDNL
jgi:hypothetical protein